jgi:steroid 5-alpha reductase family enzyme
MEQSSFFYQLFIGLGSCLLFMFFVYWWASKNKFYSSVDVAWSFGFGVLAIVYLATHQAWAPRMYLLSGMMIIWSFRLGTHLTVRLKNHFPTEDGRYITLTEKWGTKFFGPFFIFFMAQAASVAILATPLTFVSFNQTESFHFLEVLAAGLWLIGLLGESLADRQLAQFKKDPSNKGKTCEVGLWNYSRHPNYFFEWTIWVSYFVFACASPGGWITIYAPLVMLYLLFKITGIPATEAQSLKSRGDQYRRYQETTSVFVPWFKKKITSSQQGRT